MAAAVPKRWMGVGFGACWLLATSAFARAPETPACAEPGPAPSGARAAPAGDLIVVNVDAELVCALRTALDPWGIRVRPSPLPAPGSSMPSTSQAARRVARAHGARAVVWLARDPGGVALWVYDAERDRSVSRAVPEPPFEPSVAAALALSVKTTLRMVGLAPDAATPSPALTDARRDRSGETPVAPDESSRWHLLPYAGARLGPTTLSAVGVRYGAELRWTFAPEWPVPTLHGWTSLSLSAGAPTRIRSPLFEGQLWDAGVELGLGSRYRALEPLAVSAGFAVALHRAALSGTTLATGESADDRRLNPALVARLAIEARLLGVALSLGPAASLWLRKQRYLVEGTSVLRLRPVSVRLTAGFLLPLD